MMAILITLERVQLTLAANIPTRPSQSQSDTNKQVHPDTGISNKAMAILNSFVNDILPRRHPVR